MILYDVRKPTNLFFNVLSGGCCSEYLATVAFVEEVIYIQGLLTRNLF
jgi:hypothetical protein